MPGNTPTGSALAVSAGPASAGGAPVPVLDAGTFRRALARRAAGVVIVTLRGPAGLTVTSFSSAGLDPPLVSFYIGHASSNWPAVRAATYFAVNLMGTGQEEVAARFARKGADRFGPPTRWEPGPGGLPLLAGATTHLICARHAPRADWFPPRACCRERSGPPITSTRSLRPTSPPRQRTESEHGQGTALSRSREWI